MDERGRDAEAGARSWGGLPTEARHPGSADLDLLGAEAIVGLLLAEDRRGIERTAARAGELAVAARWVAEAFETGGVVLLVGAGTSGRLGVLEAAELPPTFGTDPARVRAALAGGPDAVFAAREGAEDSAEDGRAAAADLGSGDLLVGISASSVTPFVAGALAAARQAGARTLLLTCAAPSGSLERQADLVVALDTGPEVLTGSTRLKAGSATKAALNAVTTTAMVILGKVYQNFMVDLSAGSAKLRDRAVRIVAAAGEVPAAAAEGCLAAAGGEVKVAIVMARRGLDAETARRRLAVAGGDVRAALGEPDRP
jgi:N-acetylmuramic acid 6-phosphate etherase